MHRQAVLTSLFIIQLLFLVTNAGKCSDDQQHSVSTFYLIKSLHRSLQERLYVDNVLTLQECIELAIKYKGLALNYAAKNRFRRVHKDIFIESKISRDHYWNQPQLYFNCHILRCPENKTLKTLVNDYNFNYYSMYQPPVDSSNYICLPEVGLFVLQTIPEAFENASLNCRNSKSFCGSLPHVASRMRTNALTQLLLAHNVHQTKTHSKARVYLAFVGLYYNRSITYTFDMLNMNRESLKCFPYRVWEPGNPKRSSQFVNTSCVALTTQRTWRTVNCKRKLPYICEILTTCGEEKEDYLE